jgi:hypothetical protein
VRYDGLSLITVYDGTVISAEHAHMLAPHLKTHVAKHCNCIVAGLRDPILHRRGGSFSNDPRISLVDGGLRIDASKCALINAEFASSSSTDRFCLVAKKRISPGEEILVSYGDSPHSAMGMAPGGGAFMYW